MKKLHYGVVKRGKPILNYPDKWQVQLAGLEGKEVELSICQRRSIRSGRQNKYYWKVIIGILSEHFGYTKDEMHEALKYHFLKERLDNGFCYVKSTSRLNTKEMEDYHSQIRQWASIEHNCFIPDPNQGVDF